MAQSIDLFQDQSHQHGEFIDGSVVNTFFQSQDSFYKVLLVKIERDNIHWHEDKIVITGNFGRMESGKDYRFLGHLVHHPKYGDQFRAINYEDNTPTSRTGLIKYLSGDDFPGVGEQTAKRVVDALGLNLIEVILSNSKVLDSVNLSARQRHSIVNGINANNGIEQVIIGLNSYGFGSRLASTIFKKYRGNALRIIHSDPYRLVEDISGISFHKADLIARKIGLPFNSPGRLKAGLITSLRQLSEQSGDTYTKAGPLLARTVKMLDNGSKVIDRDKLAGQLLDLARNGVVVGDGQRIYLTDLYQAEIEIAKNLKRLQYSINHKHQRSLSDCDLKQNIKKIERKLKIKYDYSQVKALILAVKKPLFLLTGGPGTGKTTIIKGIVSLFANLYNFSLDLSQYKNHPYPVLLAAPTGRAANQMNEVTGIPASTIHRLLGLTSYSDSGSADPVTQELQGKILIIDEMSMVDTYLFRDLVKSIPTGMRVILVGDKDQLPSVGPGQVFHDLLQSRQIPQLELTTIHRQDSTSTIIPLAHDIKDGRLPKDFAAHKADRSFIACNTRQIGSVIRQIVQFAKMKGFSASDMQVLAPMYRGKAGINHLNEIIQQIMNPRTSDNQKEIIYHGITYRIGDKVLQLVNSPENDIFNGDIGKIVGINLKNDSDDSQDELIIAFNASEVTYKRNQWDQITLAYCTSIHKAQGSEFKMVILPMVPQYIMMLKRNLLYTAVTRASKLLVLIGNYNSFVQCVRNGSINRNTSLALRLKEVMGQRTQSKIIKKKLDSSVDSTHHILTNDLIMSHSIDPMIGMHDLSPYRFLNNKNSL